MVATVAQQAPLWPEQPGQERPTWHRNPGPALYQRNPLGLFFQPDTLEAWTDIPTLTVATAAQRAGLWIEQVQERQAWHRSPGAGFQPDNEFVPQPPAAAALTPTPQGEDPQFWQAWQRPPDESADAPFQPPAVITPNTGWLVEDVFAIPAAWLPVLDLSAEPLFLAPSAALWMDGSGQQDRALQPVWWAPDDAPEGLAPPASVIVGGIPPNAGGLYPMAAAGAVAALPGAASDVSTSSGRADASLSSGRSDTQSPSGSADGSTPSGRASS
jgi:hypothetical protein